MDVITFVVLQKDAAVNGLLRIMNRTDLIITYNSIDGLIVPKEEMRNGGWNKEAKVIKYVHLYELGRRCLPPMYIVLLILKRSCEAAYHGRPLTTIM